MSHGGFLDNTDMQLLKNNLDSITDLTGIGQIGIGSFESDMNVGGSFGSSRPGTQIIVSKNDNPNEVKNFKAELENKINQLTISKHDLDPSVFTPNKRYVVKNYNAHADKDGLFLLNKKTEIYSRESNIFKCITMLNFSKILENSTTSKAEDANTTTAINNKTNKQEWYKNANSMTDKDNKNINVVSSEGKGIKLSSVTSNTMKTLEMGSGSMSDTISLLKKK